MNHTMGKTVSVQYYGGFHPHLKPIAPLRRRFCVQRPCGTKRAYTIANPEQKQKHVLL